MYKKHNKCLEIIHGFSKEVIQHRKHRELQKEVTVANAKSRDSYDEFIDKKKRMSLLDLLMEVSEDGKVLSEKDIGEEVKT
jgi:cytochrome P450 family 4